MAAAKHRGLTKTKSATAGPLKRAIIIVMVLIAATFGAGQLQLLDLLYAKLVGPPDLGPVAFERLTRRATSNDALACPPGECGSATVDIRPPTYAETANELRQRVRRYFADKGAVLVASDDASLHDRFVVCGIEMVSFGGNRLAVMTFQELFQLLLHHPDALQQRCSLGIFARSVDRAADVIDDRQ